MKTRHGLSWAPLLCALSFATLPLSAQTLRVMSFNVRYPSPNDGPDRWELRRDMLVGAIRANDPDLIGTQELFYEQGQYIAEKAPEYEWFGISRRGNREDEHMGVFFKTARFRLVESGNFWLSETPETPGSMSWNVSLPRMVTWGLSPPYLKALSTRFSSTMVSAWASPRATGSAAAVVRASEIASGRSGR